MAKLSEYNNEEFAALDNWYKNEITKLLFEKLRDVNQTNAARILSGGLNKNDNAIRELDRVVGQAEVIERILSLEILDLGVDLGSELAE
jgi:hypothetical protein